MNTIRHYPVNPVILSKQSLDRFTDANRNSSPRPAQTGLLGTHRARLQDGAVALPLALVERFVSAKLHLVIVNQVLTCFPETDAFRNQVIAEIRELKVREPTRGVCSVGPTFLIGGQNLRIPRDAAELGRLREGGVAVVGLSNRIEIWGSARWETAAAVSKSVPRQLEQLAAGRGRRKRGPPTVRGRSFPTVTSPGKKVLPFLGPRKNR